MRRPLAVACSFAIIAGCGAFGTSSPDTPEEDSGTSSSSPDATTEADGTGIPNANPDASANDGSPDALADTGLTCTLGAPIFSDNFDNRTSADVKGAWSTLKADATISMAIASSGKSTPNALALSVGAGGSGDRSSFLEKPISPSPCHELAFELLVTGLPSSSTIAVASLELEGPNTGEIYVEIGSNSTLTVSERLNAVQNVIISATISTNTWISVVVRVTGPAMTMVISGILNTKTRTLTSANVNAIRIGAPIARQPTATYIIDDVFVR